MNKQIAVNELALNLLTELYETIEKDKTIKEVAETFLSLVASSFDARVEHPGIHDISTQALSLFAIAIAKTNSLDYDIVKGVICNDLETAIAITKQYLKSEKELANGKS